MPISFAGNVEGGDLLTGKVDVIVTDGFTGNVALKTLEGTASYAAAQLREVLGGSRTARIGTLFQRREPARAVRAARLGDLRRRRAARAGGHRRDRARRGARRGARRRPARLAAELTEPAHHRADQGAARPGRAALPAPAVSADAAIRPAGRLADGRARLGRDAG